jgi:hypothetical protein
MENSMSDQMRKIQEERRLQGEFQSLWSMPLTTEEEIHKLKFKKKLSIRTKLWLFDWYPILVIVVGGLSIIYHILEILKAFKGL